MTLTCTNTGCVGTTFYKDVKEGVAVRPIYDSSGALQSEATTKTVVSYQCVTCGCREVTVGA